MQANIALTGGLIYSQRILLELTDSGISREKSYEIVQSHAMHVWQNRETTDFLSELKKDAAVREHVSEDRLEGLFDESYQTRHVDHIFARVFD